MATDLTKGNITKHLISFTIPLILGNIFQLTYNAVDSIVIGRFAGNEALAAVGTAEPVMNFLIYRALRGYFGADEQFLWGGKVRGFEKRDGNLP